MKVEPPSDKTRKITAFFMKDMIDNKDNKEDNKPNNDNKLITNKKKTFANIDVGQKIKKFQELSDGNKCVFGSGMCATHNCKLVRGVTQKKISDTIAMSNPEERGDSQSKKIRISVKVCDNETAEGRPINRTK